MSRLVAGRRLHVAWTFLAISVLASGTDARGDGPAEIDGRPPAGALAGVVRSMDGAALPGVVLRLTRTDDAPVRIAASGEQGSYRFDDLAAAAYALQAEAPGFETARWSLPRFGPGESRTLDLTLRVAGIHETVSVVGTAPRATLEAARLQETAAYDVGDALGGTAGVWRLRKGAIANDVVLRGLQSRDLNVLIDGQRVYGACPNHMDPAAFHVDLAEIERVEVGKGPFDLKSQGGLGGTVNVVTRRPAQGWHASPTLTIASHALLNPSLTASRGGEHLSALLGYSDRRADAHEDGAGRRFTEIANFRQDVRPSRAFAAATAWGRLIWSPASGHQLDVAYTRQDADDVLYPYLSMDAIRDDTDRLNLRYEATGLGRRRASLRVQGYLTAVDHWMNDAFRTSGAGKARPYSMGTETTTRTTGGKVEWVAGGLAAGIEAYERRWDATNFMAGSGYAPQMMIPDVRVRIGGAFVEYQRALGPRLVLALGGRLDAASSRADPDKANTTLYAAYQGMRSLSAHDWLPAGKIRLAWRVGDWDLAAGVGHVERTPEASERYLALRRMGTDWVGNPGLAPSRNTALDLSAVLATHGFRLEVGGFVNHVDGYITVYDQARLESLPGVTNAAARSFANVGAHMHGGEMSLGLPILFGRLFVSGDVSWVRGEQDGAPARGIAAGPLGEMPPLRARVSARYDDGRLFALAEGVWSGDQERVDTALLEARTPGYGVMNVSCGWRQGRWRLAAGVRNVFDRFYYEHLSYQRDPFRSGLRVPEPGRSLFANAALRF